MGTRSGSPARDQYDNPYGNPYDGQQYPAIIIRYVDPTETRSGSMYSKPYGGLQAQFMDYRSNRPAGSQHAQPDDNPYAGQRTQAVDYPFDNRAGSPNSMTQQLSPPPPPSASLPLVLPATQTCWACGEDFVCRDDLAKHERETGHHSDTGQPENHSRQGDDSQLEVYKCGWGWGRCSESHTTQADYLKHRSSFHRTRAMGGEYYCPYCGGDFLSLRSMSTHIVGTLECQREKEADNRRLEENQR